MCRVGPWFFTALVLAASSPAPAEAREPVGPALLRLFLTDGTVLASYGEWARLDDRVVFSIPLPGAASDLQLVSVPADRVDWARTERYADAARGAHYAATRGETDFALLSAEVARALNDVALMTDPARRLDRAEQARRALAGWPAAHFGYRAHEVRELVGLLDEIISDMRAASGADRFEFTLVADGAPPAEPLLPPPAPSEIVEGLMQAASLATTPEDRVSLFDAVLRALDRTVDLLPASWAAGVRRTALAGLAEERALDAAYAALREASLAEAARHAARADVRALERLVVSIRARDAALGGRRQAQMAGVLGLVTSHLESARQLRLAQDRWRMQIGIFRTYQRSVRAPMGTLVGATSGLEDIRALAGPAPGVLQALASRLALDGRRVRAIAPPDALAPVHAVLRSAWELAESAIRLRLDAVAIESLDRAREASAAAAGALLLLARARADLEAALAPPVRP